MLNKIYSMIIAFVALTVVSTSAFAAVEVFVIGDDRPDQVGPSMTPGTDWITYTAWDGETIPTAEDLSQYDVVLLYATAFLPQAPQLGDVVAEYFVNGGSILTASGYMSNRSDGAFVDGDGAPNSWGDLENYDTLRGRPGGIAAENHNAAAPYEIAEIEDHPFMEGVSTLAVSMERGRGNVSTKPSTSVLALWNNRNLFTSVDPLVGVREDGFSRSVGVSISPIVTLDGTAGVDWSGDLHHLWRSAIAWAAADFEVAIVSARPNNQIINILYEDTEGLFFRGRDGRALPDDLHKFDSILTFIDPLIAVVHSLGNLIADYYENGGGVVHASLYLAARSDGSVGTDWGRFENYDALTIGTLPGDFEAGSESSEDELDPDSIVSHPVTAGVNSLSATMFRGGGAAKPSSTVVAAWSGLNDQGTVDPVAAVRDDGTSRVVGLGIAAHYEWMVRRGSGIGSYTGDLHQLVGNSLRWAAARCGDGRIDAGEVCDDGNRLAGDDCSPACQLENCGDGILHAGEECDDGNEDNRDGCLNTCVLPSCGDGFVQPGEQCDDGGQNSDSEPDTCRTDCTNPACGDGIVDSGESCDAGAANGGFQCRADCVLPTCGDGLVDPGEDCDLGDENTNIEPDTCRESCVDFYCGDGVVDFNEECDLGREQNGAEGTACSRSCASREVIEDPDDDTSSGGVSGSDGCCAQAPGDRQATPLMVISLLGAVLLWRRRRV